jgi:Asp-tRNA(Asn)/Glu-tRNA(Gln) amidotransferase A subunit family amidase
MLPEHSPLTALKTALADGQTTPATIAADCAVKANSNASHNTYIHFDAAELARDAEKLTPGGPLYGVPISLKDLFDLKGTRTTAGSRFYERLNPPAKTDSSIVKRMKESGCLITGKTHLHPLAYGLTGENLDYGDCLQPRDATVLTGGSSSGAVASVQEGSALAAIGTDTGGSIRIPAALSGLVGYRASHALPSKWIGQWSGGVHLSQSFDTLGFFVRDPRDVPPIAEALFHIPKGVAPKKPRIGCIELKFASDANPECLAAYAAWKQTLKEAGAKLIDFDPVGWQSTTEIYAGIQASEAAAIHRRHFDKLLPTLDPAIAKRLQWGASLTEDDIESLRSRHAYFRLAIATLLAQFDFLLVPSAPVNKLPVGEDYTAARNAILRYSTPFSLSGLPVITLPGELIGAPMGTGVQLAAPQLEDGNLIAYAAGLPI